jgi:DNA repair protein RadC
MKPLSFSDDAAISEIAAVLDDAGVLALAASLDRSTAEAALRDFGSLGAVMAAPLARLATAGLDADAANRVKALQCAVQRVLHGEIKGRDVLNSWSKVQDYLRGAMAFGTVEQFRILYLDKRNHLIADELHQTGTVDHTPVYPREVAKRCLEVNATALILLHNHPSGDPTPSSSDVQMTKQIAEVLKGLGVVVHDHIIVGRDGHVSLKQQGLI